MTSSRRSRRLALLAAIGGLAIVSLQTGASAASSQLVANGGFESGQVPWQIYGPNLVSSPVLSGVRSLEICNYNRCKDEAWQTVTVPTTFNRLTLAYSTFISTREAPGAACGDSFTTHIRTSTGGLVQTLGVLCNGDARNSWVGHSKDLTEILRPYAGKRLQLYFHGASNRTLPTRFVIDDVSMTATTVDTTSTSTSSTAPTSTTAPTTTVPPARWKPPVGASWQYQLQGAVDTTVGASVFDIDGFDTPSSVVQKLHSQGKRVICYLSGGTWEDWRPDAGQFPSSILGMSNGWPGEKWLDIRAVGVLKPIMQARVAQQCQGKGFDAVEWDNVDGYANNSGFPLTYQDQLAYNRMLAGLAHDAGLSVGLKNDLDQVADLVTLFDFAVNEQCNQYNECGALSPFINSGKPVFQVEYKLTVADFCPADIAARFSGIRKQLALDALVTPCQPY